MFGPYDGKKQPQRPQGPPRGVGKPPTVKSMLGDLPPAPTPVVDEVQPDPTVIDSVDETLGEAPPAGEVVAKTTQSITPSAPERIGPALVGVAGSFVSGAIIGGAAAGSVQGALIGGGTSTGIMSLLGALESELGPRTRVTLAAVSLLSFGAVGWTLYARMKRGSR